MYGNHANRTEKDTPSDETVEIPRWRVAQIEGELRYYAATLNSDGSDDTAQTVTEHADALRHIASSNVMDCPECDWPGTLLDDEANVFCDRCDDIVVAGAKK